MNILFKPLWLFRKPYPIKIFKLRNFHHRFYQGGNELHFITVISITTGLVISEI